MTLFHYNISVISVLKIISQSIAACSLTFDKAGGLTKNVEKLMDHCLFTCMVCGADKLDSEFRYKADVPNV